MALTRGQARRGGYKTAAEWYMLDTTRNVCDPDGWRRLGGWWEYWNTPISELEYQGRVGRCTCVKYDAARHRHFMRPTPDLPDQAM